MVTEDEILDILHEGVARDKRCIMIGSGISPQRPTWTPYENSKAMNRLESRLTLEALIDKGLVKKETRKDNYIEYDLYRLSTPYEIVLRKLNG